jgi:hypothetical protein
VGGSIGELLGKVGSEDGEVGWVPPPVGTAAGFHVRKGASQNLTVSAENAVSFETPVWEQGGAFVGSRFTATVPGWYAVAAAIKCSTASATVNTSIWKNGSLYQFGNSKSGVVDPLLIAVTVLYLNGTTDYVEVSAWSSIAQPFNYSSSRYNQFFGFKIA